VSVSATNQNEAADAARVSPAPQATLRQRNVKQLTVLGTAWWLGNHLVACCNPLTNRTGCAGMNLRGTVFADLGIVFKLMGEK
jgi:hypothetical protein